MAKIETDQLFTLPQDMIDDMDKGMKRMQVLKDMLPGFEALGQDTTQMKKDIAILERQYNTIKGFIKPKPVPAITEKK